LPSNIIEGHDRYLFCIMLDFRQLRYFVAVADTLHFGRAAARLHISQPPLSRQVAALEASLGVTLFERDARHVALTPAGVRLHADAREILGAIARAARNAQAAAAGEAGTLSIGFTMCAAYSVVPGYARRYAAKYPAVDLLLREVVSNDLVAQVLDRRIDAAIVFQQPLRPGLQHRGVFTEPLCLALPRAHRLAARRRVPLAELANEPFIAAAAEVAPVLRAALLAQCARAGFEPGIVMEVQLQQTILSLVAENVGVALVPSSMRQLQLDAVTFKTLPDAVTIAQELVWLGANSNPCLANLLEMVGGAA
jgi:DNA-binding transcriptional LysR family regulator